MIDLVDLGFKLASKQFMDKFCSFPFLFISYLLLYLLFNLISLVYV